MTCQPSGTELTYHSTREVVPVKNAFRDMLRLLRRAGGWSQREVAERLRRVDVNTLTPIEAMNLIYELKQKL